MNSYTFHINLYDVAFFGMIFIGLNFALLLWFGKSINRTANRFLALALVTMILWMIRILAIDVRLETYLPGWNHLPMQFLLALGPLIYLYVLKITHPRYKFSWRDLLHFSPLLLEQGAFVLEIGESIKTGAATYVTATFQQLNPVLQLLIFISIIIYLYRSHKLIQNFYRRLQPVLMDRSLLEFRWLRRLLAATALLWLLWIAYAAVDYFGYCNQLGIHIYYPFYILFTVIIIWTAAAAFLKPQAGMIVQLPPVIKPAPPVELKEKGTWLKRAMEVNLYYQDPELNLSSLAGKLGLSTHELSRIINTGLKKSFSDFINEYRVRDVAAKMQNSAYDHITLLGIAYESGFNSQATFSRIFKQVTGRSPSGYKNELKKKRSSYKLRSCAPYAPVNLRHETYPDWSHEKLNGTLMFKNHLKIAWRNLLRNKTFSFINIAGLGLGIACSLLIFLWVQDERNMNAFNTNNNIYDVYERVFSQGKVEAGPDAPGLLASELKQKIPGIKYATGFWNTGDETLLSVGDKNISLKGCHADSDFFKMFNYPLIEGTAAGALNTPDAIALSKAAAESLFGNPGAAIGKMIRFDNSQNFKITAIFDLPPNSFEKFDYVLNWYHQLTSIGWLKEWIYRSPSTFIELQPGTDPAKVEASIKNFVMPYIAANKDNGSGFRIELGLQSFNDMYLNSNFKNGVPDGGRIEYVRLFSVTALFILLIACINFMNLATARSVKRAKEVGIRKTIGAVRMRLIVQFIGETIMLTFFAVIVALAVVVVLLPKFNLLTGKQIVLPVLSPAFWLEIITIIIITGFIAGSYPALFLSSLNPVKVLKGTLKFNPSATLFRKSLVVFQFVLSVVMITGTIIIARQVRYMQTKNLGYDKENLVYIPFQGDLGGKFELYRQQLSGMPGIKEVSMNTNPPTHIGAHVYNLEWEGKDPNEKIMVIHNGVGFDYLNMMNIPVVRGRGFSRNFMSDTAKTHFVINEALAKMTGFKDPVGKRLHFFSYNGTIIGVVKDFHLRSLRDPIEPLVMYWGENDGWGSVLVKTLPGETQQALASMEKVFKEMEPRFAFRYYFVDDEYQKLYTAELTVGKLSDSFSFLAILISCLGLLGLTIFTAEQRRKEIGIRKVIGAKVSDIVMMLSKDIISMVILSAIIAVPIAWLAMNSWLQNFAFHIDLSVWIFLIAAGATLLIALLTIGYQAIKTALANPVRSLRSE